MRPADLLWPEWLWLPPGVGWRHLRRGDGDSVFKAAPSDLWVSLPCAVALLAARRLLENFLLRPLGRRLGLSDSHYVPVSDEDKQLEAAYQRSVRSGGSVDYAELSERLGRSQTLVSNWFRARRNKSRDKRLTKFAESGWQFLFYSAACLFGAAILWDKPFLYDTLLIWRGWPQHHVTDGMYWYYMVEIGYYLSALVTVCSDTRRKDFGQMVLHHLVTLYLMAFSWSVNLVRIGALVLLVHDVADPLLNLAKIGNYMKVRWISDPAFFTFMFLWLLSRLVVYPLHMTRSTIFELGPEIGTSPMINSLQLLLVVLLMLHIVWTYHILKIPFRLFTKGTRQDSRSDSEDSSTEADRDDTEKKK